MKTSGFPQGVISTATIIHVVRRAILQTHTQTKLVMFVGANNNTNGVMLYATKDSNPFQFEQRNKEGFTDVPVGSANTISDATLSVFDIIEYGQRKYVATGSTGSGHGAIFRSIDIADTPTPTPTPTPTATPTPGPAGLGWWYWHGYE